MRAYSEPLKSVQLRKGQKEYEVFDEALRAFLGLDVVSETWKESNLKADEALKLAYREIHEARR